MNWYIYYNDEFTPLSPKSDISINAINYPGEVWTSWDLSRLAENNIYPASVGNNTAPTRFHIASGLDYTFENNTVIVSTEYQPLTLDAAKNKAFMLLAAWRWMKEEGGTTLGEMQIATDRVTQAKVTGAYIKAQNDSNYVISDWKLDAGVFISLDAATIIAIGDAITAHVQACFTEEANISDEISAAVNVDELEAILTSHGI